MLEQRENFILNKAKSVSDIQNKMPINGNLNGRLDKTITGLNKQT